MLLCSGLYAQAGFKVGGFFLPQLVWLSNADDANLSEDRYRQELLGGMAGGIQLGYNVKETFGIRLNVIYSQQGGRYTRLNGEGTRVNEVTRLEYFQVPLMIGLNTSPENNKIMLALYGGVQLGVLTKAWQYNDNTEFETPLSDRVSTYPTLLQAYESMDLSLVGDAGIDVKLDYDLALNFHLRLNYSLQDVENKEAFVRTVEQGIERSVSYWDFVRGTTNRGPAKNIALGLMMGITYSFE